MPAAAPALRGLRAWLPADGRDAVRVAALAAAYILAGKVGLSLASVHPSATAVWAPTGIAIAALLLWGPRVWPGVLLGAFVVNATTAGTWATSFGIATGNTLEGLAAAWLVQRLAQGPRFVERAREVFAFAGLVAVACGVSATIGPVSLALAGFAAWGNLGDIAATWWLGDLAGALVVAPFVVAWAPRWRGLTARDARHAGLLVAASALVGLALFAVLVPAQVRAWPLEFIVIPLVVLAAYLEGPRGAATSTVVLSAFAVAGTVQGRGPFGDAGPQGLVLLQGFMAVASLTGLALAAVVQDRERMAAELRRARDDLEGRVAERTASLRREVDERERARAALAEREAQLQQAQRLASLGSWEWDVAADRVTWSDELYRIWGLHPGEFAASYQGYLERLHPEDRDGVDAAVRRAFETGASFGVEHRIVRPGGEVRHILGSGKALRGPDGAVTRMAGVAFDITALRRAEEASRAAFEQALDNRRLQEVNRMKTDFINAAAHELNTPLTPILLQLRRLADSGLQPEQRERSLRILQRNVDRMALLVQEMLDVARLQSGKLQLSLERLALADVAYEVAATFEDLAAEQRVRLEVDVPPDLLVQGDPTRLAQVLNNLVSNALKFTPPGGHVRVAARAEGAHAVLRVADTGAGFDPEQRDRLFQPFTQVHDGPSRPLGTGLGLYISKGIVEQHGGSIVAESDGPGKGATFGVELPLAPPGTGEQPKPKTPP